MVALFIFVLFFFVCKDEKLQDVLGHFQKDFEGGLTAENLGKSKHGRNKIVETVL